MTLQNLTQELKQMFPEGVYLSEPYFCGNEKKYLNECIETGWVSTGGKFVSSFEKQLGDFVGGQASVVCNGTSALQLSYLLSNVGPEDEVLLPTLTFVATANAIKYLGATPHFIDSEEEQFGVDPKKLEAYLSKIAKLENGQTVNKETGRPIKACVTMHTFGFIGFVDELKEVCQKYNITLIEDAAEALGSTIEGRHAGTIGEVAALSFNGNKVMTTGGGGAVISTNNKIIEHCRHLVNQAKVSHPWEFIHDQVGYNFRMPNLNAAVGLAQLECLPQFLEKKRGLHKIYQEKLSSIKGMSLVSERPGTTTNYWLNAILLEQGHEAERDKLLKENIDLNIHMRPVWRLMHKLEMYKNCPRMTLDTAESLEKRIINLPSSVFLVDRLI